MTGELVSVLNAFAQHLKLPRSVQEADLLFTTQAELRRRMGSLSIGWVAAAYWAYAKFGKVYVEFFNELAQRSKELLRTNEDVTVL